MALIWLSPTTTVASRLTPSASDEPFGPIRLPSRVTPPADDQIAASFSAVDDGTFPTTELPFPLRPAVMKP